MSLFTVNVEQGMPLVPQARIRLEEGLRVARSRREVAVKIIHGYGSTGKGGAIKQDVHRQLAILQSKQRIKNFLPGEHFTPFHEQARAILSAYPQLRKDSDYSRDNAGITIVLL